MKRSNLYFALGVLAFFAAGWAGFTLYTPVAATGGLNAGDIKIEVVDSPLNETPETSVVEQPSTAVNALRLMAQSERIDTDSPSMCFTFNSAFGADQAVALRDFFTVTPSAPLTLSVVERALCLSGFSYTQSYEVTWKAGLASAAGAALAADTTKTVSFGDKPAFVAFAGEGVILPRQNAQGLAVETINIDTLSVKIYRISDRMLPTRNITSGSANQEGDYGWEGYTAGTDIRREIWSGDIAVKSTRNEKVTTVLPLRDMIGVVEAGAYVVSASRKADDTEREMASAWRWIISTDLALTSYRSDSGLLISARSIESAKLQSGVRLVLLAENNEIIGEVETGADGRARFDKALMNGTGEMRATSVMAYGTDGDYAVLDLSRSPLDLSRYDIDGRDASGPVDIFAYTERGVYRPGETVHFTALIRDERGFALTDRAATVEVIRPNGIVMDSKRVAADTLAKTAGGISYRYDVPTSAARGMWSIKVTADGIKSGDVTQFSVQDFVPQKLRLGLKMDETPMGANDVRDITLDAQFLYGAPGAGLEAEAEARLRIDTNPFPAFKDFRFGPDDEGFRERVIDIGAGVTDGKGLLDLALNIRAQDLSTSHPLRAEITAGAAEPGGRYTRNSLRVPVRAQADYIGIKSTSGVARFPKDKPAQFSLIAVNNNGAQIASAASYQLISEDWDYQWYRDGSRWRYRRDVIDTVIEQGNLAIGTDGAAYSKRLDWGSYRLVLTSASGSESSYRFSMGWGRGETSDAPDQIQMAGPVDAVTVGQNFTLDINAPYAGEAELVIASRDIHVIKTIRLPEGGSQITLPFEASWGQGVYAMVSLYTPRDAQARPVPRRAVGIDYIALDRSAQTLNLTLNAPELIRPRKTQDIVIDVDNARRRETVYLTLAAVDEGILQITKYKSPEAAKTLFAKKSLCMEIFDDYARLLNPNLGAPTMANSGGDSLGGEGLTVVPTRTVALFEGPVTVVNGKAAVTLDIPDFNGELRLMATAWSDSSVGSASRPITVRDKVPAIIGLPRFLAPGDKSLATVSLDNIEGAAGAYNVTMDSRDVVISGKALSLTLEPGVRGEDRLPISASSVGIDNLSVAISGPDGYAVTSDYPIEVRTPFRPVTRTEFTALPAGETLTLTRAMVGEGLIAGSVDIDVSFSPFGGLNPTPYLASLSRYPYGCTEQTVATALPLLYTEALGGFEGDSSIDDARQQTHMQAAISRLVNRQDPQGVFGLWSEGDGAARAWLGVHVTFFLQEAEAAGYAVPKDTMDRAYKAIAEIARMPRYANVNYRFNTDRFEGSNAARERAESAAYAHYVLARAGRGKLPAIRYHFDQNSGDMRTPVSFAYLAAALSMMGDERRAEKAFAAGLEASGFETDNDYYQSQLRDNGGFIAAAHEVGAADAVAQMLPLFRAQLDKEDYLSTQEKAYVILAMQALFKDAKPPNVSAEGISLTANGNVQSAKFYDTTLSGDVRFTNDSTQPVYASVTYSGAPRVAPEPFANGFTISKRYRAMDGKPLELSNMAQGERAIVQIDFSSTSRRSRMAIIADLLPAGVEIETVLRPKDAVVMEYGERTEGPYAFLGALSDFDIIEARDDRLVASRETYRQDDYRLAYIIRAVTPGEFANPGVVVEDMYRPEDQAVTAASRLSIGSKGAL